MMGIGDEFEREATQIFEATRTPLEKFEQQMNRLRIMLKTGLFADLGGLDTFNRAVAKLREELEKATKKKEPLIEREGQFREVRFGQVSMRSTFRSPEHKAAEQAAKHIAEINRKLLALTSNGKLQVEVSL